MKARFSTTLIGIVGIGSAAAAQGSSAPYFQPAVSLGAPSSPSQVVSVDFDRDGFPDIAASGLGANQVRVYQGSGSGAFTTTTVPTSILPTSLLAADLDADSKPDLLYADSSQPGNASVVYRPGNGAFGFGPEVVVTLGSSMPNPSCLALGDIDADGTVDIAVGFSSGGFPSVGMFLNSTSSPGLFGGVFLVACPSTGAAPVAVVLRDFDTDGRADLVLAGGNTATANNSLNGYLYSPSTGTHTLSFYIDFTNNLQQAVEVADMNGDGLLDLSVACKGPAGVQRFHNTGTPTAPAFLPPPYQAGPGPILTNENLPGVLVTELFGSGQLDECVADFGLNAVVTQIYFEWLVALFIDPVGARPVAIAAADFDLDARTDLVTANRLANTLSLLRQGHSSFPNALPYGSGTAGCFGTMALRANSAPAIHSPQFAFIAANAPRNCIATVLVGDLALSPSADQLGLGISMAIDLVHGGLVACPLGTSDPNGTLRVPAPIPNDPALVGVAFHCQAIALEVPGQGQRCNSGSPVHLVSSAGLRITP